jgi:XTP/dITP diphosphohydrolase
MLDKTLIIASHNEGKVSEIRVLIQPLGIKAISAGDAGVDEPEETGLTFAANAELKARNAVVQGKLAALADDSGLVIPALGGDPGIYSARWAGPGKDFSAAFSRIQADLAAKAPGLKNVPAYFICVLSLCFPDGSAHLFEGRVDGILTFPPRGNKGFGYDPIFIPEGHSITFAEMDPAKKHLISHRARAFKKFIAYLKSR